MPKLQTYLLFLTIPFSCAGLLFIGMFCAFMLLVIVPIPHPVPTATRPIVMNTPSIQSERTPLLVQQTMVERSYFGFLPYAARSNEVVMIMPSATPIPTSTPLTAITVPSPTPNWMAPAYTELCDKGSSLTWFQQTEVAKSMKDKKVIDWKGKVYDVIPGEDSFSVEVNMRDGIFRTRDVILLGILPDIAKPLNVDQPVVFSGTIKKVGIFGGLICIPFEVVNVSLQAQ